MLECKLRACRVSKDGWVRVGVVHGMKGMRMTALLVKGEQLA